MEKSLPNSSFVDRLSVFLATGCGIGMLPSAVTNVVQTRYPSLKEKKWTGAGFLGSIEGVLTYLFLPMDIAFSGMALVIAVILSVVISQRAEKVLNSHDDSRIVIDEWIGTWIALYGLPQHFSLAIVISFVLFRIFDVLKGFVGHRLQRLPGGWGVTMDDVYAGILANILCRFVILRFLL